MTVAIIVPTFGRETELPALGAHLLETAGHDFTLYFIVNDDDFKSQAVIKQMLSQSEKVKMLETKRRRVGEVFEFGYQNTTEDFVFMTGDDMYYKQDFLKKAMEEIGDKGALAVADENSGSWCVFLVRRAYVQEKSCVIDRPNTMLNVDYDRIADSELVFTLQSRGDLAYASFFCDHRSPLFYGSKKLTDDKKNVEVSYNQYLIRDHSIPYSEVLADIVENGNGVRNILRVRIVPKKPMLVDSFRYNHYGEEANKKDEELLKERSHLWGGQLYHEVKPKVCLQAS